MKDYVNQFYTEGLATTFYLKPIKYINRVIKNKSMRKVVGCVIKVLYTIFAFVLAWFIFLEKYPL